MRELSARVGDEVLSGGVGTSESELRDPAGDEHLFPLDSQVETAASRRMEQCARGLADGRRATGMDEKQQRVSSPIAARGTAGSSSSESELFALASRR